MRKFKKADHDLLHLNRRMKDYGPQRVFAANNDQTGLCMAVNCFQQCFWASESIQASLHDGCEVVGSSLVVAKRSLTCAASITSGSVDIQTVSDLLIVSADAASTDSVPGREGRVGYAPYGK